MMPRDMDLIRQLMLRFETGDVSVPDGHTKEEVAYHVKQLIDAGFLDGETIMAPSPGKRLPREYFVRDITWKGHDFIKAVREDTLWNRTKEHFKSKAVPFTIDLILEFIKSQGRARLGL
jgi:hypothetical protein